MTTQHGVIREDDGSDDITRGIHIIQGFADVTDEAGRAAIVVGALDEGRVVRQTAGTVPGWYLAITAGTGLINWRLIVSATLIDPIPAKVTTTDATETTLATYTTATNDRGVVLEGTVQAYETATDDHSVWKFTLRAHRDAGGTVTADNLHISNGPDQTAGAVLWALDADGSSSDIRLRVTGEAAHTIKWSVRMTVQESE